MAEEEFLPNPFPLGPSLLLPEGQPGKGGKAACRFRHNKLVEEVKEKASTMVKRQT
jgi:hypothetical protein